MAGSKNSRLDSIARYNRLIERQIGRAVRPYREDGYVNLINRYGTQKDQSEQYRFMPEPEYPDELMTMYYEGNGLFAKIIDTPAEEAVKHGFELSDVKDSKIIDFYEEALDELDWEETAMTSVKWARLFGGSIAVMLINDGRGLEEPLDWRHLKSIDDIRVYDRSLVQPDYSSLFVYDAQDPFRTRGSRLGMPERYQVFSKYGNFTVHESRCLVFQNGILPENTRSTTYQLWGVPEYVRIHRAVRDAEIAHSNAPKLLDRSVQAIYKMKNLAMELATDQGEETLLRRLQAIDLARGMMNSIAIDADGEDYDFKSFQFSGITDVISASCNMLSAVSNIPQVILFGSPVGGLSTADDTALENYYNFVERIQKRQLRSNLRYLLSIIFQAGVRTGEIDEVPKIKVQFKPLWSLSDAEQADLEQKRASTQQTKAQTAQLYVDMQVIDPTEVRKKLADSEEFDVENMLDEYDEEDLFGEEIPEGLQYLSEEDQQKALQVFGEQTTESAGTILEEGSFAGYGEGVDLEAHNTDPGTEGSASTAAPAATKLPQDMSEEEKAKAKSAPANRDSAEGKAGIGGVGVLCVKDGTILVAQRKQGGNAGLFCGPGGHIEDGETPEQAAYRETEEEFGISPKQLIQIGYGPQEPETGYTPAVFLCTDWDGEPQPLDGEMGDPMWIAPETLEQLRPSLFPPFATSIDLLYHVLNRRNDADDDIDWITVNGAHIPLKEGVAVAGGELKGKNLSSANSAKSSSGKSSETANKCKALSDSLNSALKSEDYDEIRDATEKALEEMPVGSSLDFYGAVSTKVSENEWKTTDPWGNETLSSAQEIADSIAEWEDEYPEIKIHAPEDATSASTENHAPEKQTPKDNSATPNKADLGKVEPGGMIKTKDGALWTKQDVGYYVNEMTGEIGDVDSLQDTGAELLEYTGKTEFQYNGGVTQKRMNEIMCEMTRNQIFQEGEATLTSKDVEDMVGSIKHYGLGGDCQMILWTQNPEQYKDMEMYFHSEEQKAQFAREADNIERFIALSDKVQSPIYRGVAFNTAVCDQTAIEQTLSQLKPGETISMGHIASWTINKGTARSYAYGGVDLGLEEGVNYAVVYNVKNNVSAASLKGINPEGECLSPKSAAYKVVNVRYSYDDNLECHYYDVDLEEIGP